MNKIILASMLVFFTHGIYSQSNYFGISSGGVLNSSVFISIGQPITESTQTGIVYLFWDDLVTSIDDIEVVNKIIIKPNPVYGTLHFSNSINANEVKILSLDGKIIRSFEINHLDFITIDLNELFKGMYILSLYNDGNLLSSRKFIKN